MTSINWNELMDSSDDGGGFEALPAGEYEVVITDSKAKVASTGRNMFEVRFQVESGPYKGRTVFNNFVIVPENETARKIFTRNMVSLGLTKAYFDKNPTLEQAAEDMVDRRCKVRVSIRTYGGRERNQVDSVFPPSSSGPPVTPGPSPFTSTAPPPPPFSGEPPF